MPQPYIYQNTKHIKADGTAALYLRLNIAGETAEIPLNISVKPEDFDKTKNQVTGGNQKKDFNLKIKEWLGLASGIVRKYDANNYPLTKSTFIKEMLNPAVFTDFHAFMMDCIEARMGEIQPSTVKVHRTVAKKLKEFKKDLLIVELTPDFIRDFTKHLRVKDKHSETYVHSVLKTIKTYTNMAMSKELLRKDPFVGYKKKNVHTDPIFLEEQEYQKLVNAYNNTELSEKHRRTLRWFLFACQTGLRISDLVAVTQNCITSTGMLSFIAQKTKTRRIRVEVPLTDFAKKLIADENRPYSPDSTIFDCYNPVNMNLYIKEIARILDIRKDLHFHCARHTFATRFLRKSKKATGIIILQRLLGHSEIKSTMVYSHVVGSDLREAMRDFEG